MSQADSSDEQQSADDVEAKLVLKVRTACQIAKMSLEDIADEYERERFEKYLSKAETLSLAIEDSFYKSAALHSTILLAAKGGYEEKAQHLLALVSDDFVREKVQQDLMELRRSAT